MRAVEEVSFELERFEWTSDDRLVVVGRWNGVRGRRISRPALTVESGGRRRRVSGSVEGDGDAWRASFPWDGGDIAGAELEIGRSLVVELPPPRRRRRRGGDGDLRAQVDELRVLVAELQRERDAEVARLTAELEAARRAESEPDEELAALRVAHGSLKAAHEQLEDELEELRGVREERDRLARELAELREAGGDAEREKAKLGELIHSLQEQASSFEATSERLSAELAAAREEVTRLQQLVAEHEQALEEVRADAERRVESERAAVTEVHARLASAREEAQRTMVAEAEETERLRAELARTRDECERLLAIERAEVARLREELLSSEPLEEADGEESARRMLEHVTQELERERAVTRTLRRELDEARGRTPRVPAGSSNGTLAMDEPPAPATVAGRVVRTQEGVQRRVAAARAAASARVPQVPPSPLAVWTVRIAAALLVVLLGVAAVVLVSLIA
jgi:hypothetical protein